MSDDELDYDSVEEEDYELPVQTQDEMRNSLDHKQQYFQVLDELFNDVKVCIAGHAATGMVSIEFSKPVQTLFISANQSASLSGALYGQQRRARGLTR